MMTSTPAGRALRGNDPGRFEIYYTGVEGTSQLLLRDTKSDTYSIRLAILWGFFGIYRRPKTDDEKGNGR